MARRRSGECQDWSVRKHRAFIVALATAGLGGFVVGSVIGLRHWSPAWPALSALSVLRAGAVGWLVGIALGAGLGWRWSRHSAGSTSSCEQRRWTSPSLTLVAIGLAPGILWLPGMTRIGPMRKATAIGRRLGDHRPNLVLITIDALRSDYVGSYAGSPSLTPNLDAFAREATRYSSAYASSPWTLTSLGALFTSLPPSECGLKVPGERPGTWHTAFAKLPEDRALLSERLQRAGYVTAADVTNVFLEPYWGWARGFDYFRNEGGADGDRADCAHAQTLAEHAVAWSRLNWRQPFFLWVHYLDPHCPYLSPDTPAEVRARYPPDWVARRDRWYYGINSAPPETKALYRRFCREMYAEEVRYADRWVGELLRGLKALGTYDDSLIVITADHGEELFDHGGLDHGHSMHEEVVSVPLLVKWPGGVTGDKLVTQTVPLMAVAGTLLHLARAPGLNERDQALPTRDQGSVSEVYSEGIMYGTEHTALTTDDYRIIYHPYDASRQDWFEVYDRRRDRRERHNLADTEAAWGLRSRLKQLTEAAERAAVQAGGGPGARRFPLPDGMKRRMKSLGYVGN